MSRVLPCIPPAFASPALARVPSRGGITQGVACRAAPRGLSQKEMGERVAERLSRHYPELDAKFAHEARSLCNLCNKLWRALKAVLDAIVDEVAAGQKVQFTGFGTFAPKARAARQTRNPRNGEVMQIKATTVPGFTAGKRFKEVVKEAAPAVAEDEAADAKVPVEV